MKVLFAMASGEYLRHYDSVIRLLAERGHDVVLAVNHDRTGWKLARAGRKPVQVEAETTDTERVSMYGVLPSASAWWGRVAVGLRGTMDFVRYLDPRLAGASALRTRIRRKVLPAPMQWLGDVPSLGRRGTRAVLKVLAALEQAIPTVPAIDRLFDEMAPDAIIVSPLVDAASLQVDLVKSARRRHIPVAVAIASWDNLTNKGLLRIAPDLVVVWNEMQRAEAVTLHGMDPSRVAVTGAQLFDIWFDRGPRLTRDELGRRAGLPGTSPFLLFTCSSSFISQGSAEVAFVRRWVTALRASPDPAIAALPVLVRPHPYNTNVWSDVDVSDLADVAVWPRGPFNPMDEGSRADLFDSLFHSAAVVGVNTSAMIEAAIVGRPVFSIRAPEFEQRQEGTLHFHHLLPERGGFVQFAGTLDEHVRQLLGILANPDTVRQTTARFVEHFVRPHGRDLPATPIFADLVESLPGRRTPGARVTALAALPLRPLVWVLAAGAATAVALPQARRRWHRTLMGARKQSRKRWHRARKTLARLSRTAVAGR